MGRIIFLLVCLLLPATSLMGQSSIKEYVLENTTKIYSIDPNQDDYADLEVIGKAIGNAQVVMLGEQDHGDAPTFQAKTRLIKYLHEKKGFNVVAFESDFYALHRGWEQVLNNKMSASSLMANNIFSVWTKCQECDDVFSYINTTQTSKNRIHVTGFDIQLHGFYSQETFISELTDYLTAKEIDFLKTPEFKKQFLPLLDSLLYYTQARSFFRDEKTVHQLENYLRLISSQIMVKNRMDTFWHQALESVKAQTTSMIYRKNMWVSRTDVSKGLNLRDEYMAKNLHWLASNTYKNEKIIVWAANGHVNKGALNEEHETAVSNNITRPMGYVFTNIAGNLDKTYILGFTSYEGTAGRVTMPNKFAVFTPQKDGLEDWLGGLNYSFSFTNMQSGQRNKKIAEGFFSAKLKSHRNVTAAWTKGFDGIFYIHTMYPCQAK
ncbi:erythromycin esterase family protein [Adhaeribacter rhizoryzae]|uniref:Erythromycin esterase family protein n=1 Tax=Adhaeribacter rhizoryzae TaxID=2607907 RepID=A0A5M6D0I2_9BACT|nr:erythromycin esterase family protein [Adhaeribacter rhizoryzae]KAA5540566.1 erythromycin esterase family protein [Adhaeribacter rhizoryzae]